MLAILQLLVLFVNDIRDYIDLNNLTDTDIEQLSLYMLLFADDIALFTTNPESLQLQIDNLYHYSTKWGLKINVNKTKICIFEKRKQRHNYEWQIDNEKLDIVDNFCYLGIRFHYTGNMSYAVTALSEQALEAYNSLLSDFTIIKLDIKTKLSLFDSMVVPNLLRVCDQNMEYFYVRCNCRVVESEYHFLLCCPIYRTIRCKYIKNSSFPSINKFNAIIASSNKSTINNVAKYITEALKIRQETLENLLAN